MIQKDYFTNKKVAVTYFLSILILMTHTKIHPQYTNSPVFENVYDGFAVIPEAGTFLFFIISACLFYRNYTYDKTIPKIKSRIFTLVIPYLIWNTINMLFEYMCSYTFISNFFTYRVKAVISLENVLKGIFLHEYYGPFWFLQNLIIFMFLSPIIYFLLKNKRTGLCVLAFLYCLLWLDIGVPELLLYRTDCHLYYMTGAYIGIHYFDRFKKKIQMTFKSGLIYSLLFVGCISGIIALRFLTVPYMDKICPPIFLLCCLSAWRLFDLLPNKGYFMFQTESFMVYAAHSNISSVITKMLHILLPVSIPFIFVNYFLTITITLVIIGSIAYVLRKYTPRLKEVLTGR